MLAPVMIALRPSRRTSICLPPLHGVQAGTLRRMPRKRQSRRSQEASKVPHGVRQETGGPLRKKEWRFARSAFTCFLGGPPVSRRSSVWNLPSFLATPSVRRRRSHLLRQRRHAVPLAAPASAAAGRDTGRSPAWCTASAPGSAASPPTIAKPSGRRSSEPAPLPSISGRPVSIAAIVVIRIGRKRSRQAWRIASSGVIAVAPLGGDGEVHHHDAVLLHDADQQDDADQRDHRQVVVRPASASAARRRRPTAAWTGWSAAGCSSRTGCPG